MASSGQIVAGLCRSRGQCELLFSKWAENAGAFKALPAEIGGAVLCASSGLAALCHH